MSAFDDFISILDGFEPPPLVDELPKTSLTYFSVTSSSQIPLRKLIPVSEQRLLLERHYHPEKSGDISYFYDSIPESETWRLLLDLKLQQNPKEQGYIEYEKREPGSLQCMLNAFKFVCDTIQKPLTPDYIRSIHRIAAKACPPILRGFHGWSGPKYEDIRAGEFKTSNFGTINMSPSWITPLGELEMKRDFRCLTYVKGEPHAELKDIQGDYQAEVLKLILILEKSLKSSNPFEKLKAIVLFTQQLERLHAFADGNTRTCITLLMNRELVRQGFTPSLLKDPNRFDGYALEEIIFEVLRGMENFRHLKNTGGLPKCASVSPPGKK